MTMIVEKYPHFVNFPRTQNWFSVDWRDISSWCTQTFGRGNWEYYGGGFRFIHERDLINFILRWK